MNDIQKRFKLFLFLCIPARLSIAYFIYKRKYIDLYKFILFFIGFGFAYIYALERVLRYLEIKFGGII